ncbi:helix-turn-helix domain-containing protein [Clostridium butyricum]|uniref:helix-turn-helix domain-containing protein n=1 Tax=Clostridium butyricum TaxID=1492 RepID=UPI0004039155|nr:helix-turn-helix transcriptional regulator [Clostridium butyricum]MCQ2017249.1 helix-turn-helix domain-containing protein [Clostridium butyricum]MCQ2021122.1 helix-turn-helix domain-containing protein [Clostridium butyricum]NFB72482.1 XRE family transcriptional regulator [Clostridium butyricum]NFB91593.1 XRE family transcriptional regulator [Clostridium butyricum]UTY53610.1 helix-turn-helix transcriptional regulator [Clostridium butyricum]
MFKKEKIIAELDKKGWSRYKLCKEANMAQSTLSDILGGKNVSPKTNTLQRIANALEVPINTFFDDTNIDINESVNSSLVINNDTENIKLSKKAEKDIQKSLSHTLDMLQNSQDGLMFDGEPLDDLTRELLTQSLENSMRLAKKIAKEKYTPKKYKK